MLKRDMRGMGGISWISIPGRKFMEEEQKGIDGKWWVTAIG
jgi:hypothetical protein